MAIDLNQTLIVGSGAKAPPYTASIPQIFQPVKMKKDLFRLIFRIIELAGLAAFLVLLIVLLLKGGI